MRVIGDVHGNINVYWKYLQKWKDETSIQVGDFGFKEHHDWFLQNIDYSKHKILFGNHDYYPYLDKPHSCGNWYFDEEESVFCIRGANSIDKYRRIEGLDWFSNEELTYTDFYQIMDEIEKVKPKIIISHDCPALTRSYFFPWLNYEKPTLTNQMLDAVFDLYQPKLWIFGHHHKSRNEIINSTRFICLAELEVISTETYI